MSLYLYNQPGESDVIMTEIGPSEPKLKLSMKLQATQKVSSEIASPFKVQCVVFRGVLEIEMEYNIHNYDFISM